MTLLEPAVQHTARGCGQEGSQHLVLLIQLGNSLLHLASHHKHTPLSRWMMDLKVNDKTLQLLEEDIGEYLYNLD